MDSKRKISQEEDACENDGKRNKVRHFEIGSSSGEAETLAINFISAENDMVEVDRNGDKGKGKAIVVTDEASCPREHTVSTTVEKNGEEEMNNNCEHFWIWKQGIGHVCWICDTIKKTELHPRPLGFGSWNHRDVRMRVPVDGLSGTGIFVDPWHKGLMKPHHIEILNFLSRNLAGENPNGCILAQAPVSEKTFLMVSFIHSYMSRYPDGKPLFILPKWIIEFWKKEFAVLEVTKDVKLMDLYTTDTKEEPLEVLRKWLATKRSILFLGQKYFANLIAQDNGEFRDILNNAPSIVIFDSGTDPRNEMKKYLKLVAGITTPRRVILTGTLHQSHIREIFNLLNVVFPYFLRHNQAGNKLNTIFNSDVNDAEASGPSIRSCDLLEETILSQLNTNHGEKSGYLTELRMLTHKLIYSYKGEFRVEAPGLMDFTVVLKPSTSQMSAWEIVKSARCEGYKTYSTLSGITLHPTLSAFSKKGLPPPKDDDIDNKILKDINVEEGVKVKFLLGLIKLCSHTNEKILVVSQYVIPLIFLQRLLIKIKGWRNGKEIFMLKGGTTRDHSRESSINQFNNSPEAKVFLASIKSCSEQISLTGATRVVLLDINSSLCMVRQAIELAYNPKQKKKVYTYRLVAADTTEEEEDMNAAIRELVAGVWLDGKSYPVNGKFQLPTIEGKYTSDNFLGASYMSDDIKTIYTRGETRARLG